jgi:hypothetical protein
MPTVDRGDEFIHETPEVDAAEQAEIAAKTSVQAEPDPAVETENPASAAEDKDEKAEAPRDDKGRFIPKSRFDDAVRKEREGREYAERQVAELQRQLQQSQRQADSGELEKEIKGLEKQYTKLVLQGDEDAAAEVMSQIRLKERTVAIQEATHLSAQAKDQAREEIRMESAIERIEAAYPELRDGSEEYDQDLVDLVLAAQAANINQRRMAPSVALATAVETVMGKVARKTNEPAGEKKGLAAATGAADRKAAQVEKNVDAARRQPPQLKSVGADSDKFGERAKVDVTKLTREEFAALPEATKARLRGDYFEDAA